MANRPEIAAHSSWPAGERVRAAGPGGVATWLDVCPQPVLAVLHTPLGPPERKTAVLICPPFGWEEMTSHRARRRWAVALAEAGFTAARIDLPGTGDSGGSPRDRELVRGWVDAVSGTSEWLRHGCERLVAIGIGLGGVIACQAVAEGAPIDDLILWAVRSRGGMVLRDLRMFAGIIAASHADAAGGPPLADGAIEVTGFYVSAETQAAIDRIQIDKLEFPDPKRRRALLLSRDGVGIDRRLRAHLEQSGVQVTSADVRDYELLVAEPYEAKSPDETIHLTIDWLVDGDRSRAAAPMPRGSSPPPVAVETVEMTIGDARIRETPVGLRIGQTETVGILSEPVTADRQELCAVLLNPGALRRIGPSRMWVEIARSWAARGVSAVRFDSEGIGDSDGDEDTPVDVDALYERRMIDSTTELLAGLRERGIAERFILVGYCASAYWSFHSAIVDASVVGAFNINQYTFFWSAALDQERMLERVVGVVRAGPIRRIRQSGLSRHEIRQTLHALRHRLSVFGRPSAHAQQTNAIVGALDVLRDRGTHMLILLSRKELLQIQLEQAEILDAVGRWPNLQIEQLPTADHMTRAIWLQQVLHQRLDRALDELLHDLSTDRRRLQSR